MRYGCMICAPRCLHSARTVTLLGCVGAVGVHGSSASRDAVRHVMAPGVLHRVGRGRRGECACVY